jgi:WhiB family redox-sensing transcriptional regulator
MTEIDVIDFWLAHQDSHRECDGLGLTDPLNSASASGLRLPCRVGDVDLWFSESPTELECAKQLCGACPIRAQCLAGALIRREPWGVWGGEIFECGAIVARKRPRGRPRKAAPEGDREPCRGDPACDGDRVMSQPSWP